jgi:3-oxoacyl-[acyl-carrier protein] reductase
MAAMSPLGRLAQPADVANVVAFLAGWDGRWITGQSRHASGGIACARSARLTAPSVTV